MDGQYYDLVAMGTTLEDFSKISKQTTSTTLNTIENGYIGQNSSDPLIGKMGSSVIGEIEQIEQSNNNIVDYWSSYNNDVAAVDKALASEDKNTGEINSQATSNYINSNLSDKLGEVDTSKIPEFNLGKTLTTLGQGITNMLTGNNSGTVGNKSDQDSETNDVITNLVNSLGSLNIAGQLMDPNAVKNLTGDMLSKIGQLTSTFMTTADENLPAATTALTDYLQATGIFSQKSATELNELVNAYVSEGVNATLQGAAAFSSHFDYETVGKDYISATTTLAEETTKGAQAGLKTGFSNFDFGPIIASGVAGVGTMAAGIATNPTNLGSYLNPVVDVAAATLTQAIPAISSGATAFVSNFDTNKVIDGYIRASINAAKITAAAAKIGVKEGIAAVDVDKLSSVTGTVFNNVALACGEAYAQLMETFNNFASSVNIPQLPGFSGGGSSGDGSGSGGIDWNQIWQNPNLSPDWEKLGLQSFDITIAKDAMDSIDGILNQSQMVKWFDSIDLSKIPNSGFKNVGEYREAVKKAMVIENANYVTLLPEFLFAARNTVQMAAYAPQITYDKGAELLNDGLNTMITAKNHAYGYADTNPEDIKVITSIGDSCQSGWGLDAYNAKGQYIVANENVEGSAPMLVGEALGADVHQLHMPGARTTEVLQILNPLSSGTINKTSVPFISDILGIFDPNHATSFTNSPAQVLTPLLYGFGDHYTDPVMGAMTPQYTSDALVSYREEYIKSIQESDVVVLDIGMNDYWVPFAGAFYQIARDGGAGTDDLMKDMNDDPLGWMAKFCVNLATAWATHPDKWLLYGTMILETPFKWAFDYYVNYFLIVSLIHYYNPDAEIVLVGGYNPCEGWDLIPGMDDNLISYFLQAFQNFHDLFKKGLCVFYPANISYADMRGVEIQSDETTMVLPSLDSDMYNPHPTEKGAYQQADKILTALNADSPYKEQIKGDEGYYKGEGEFFETISFHVPRKYVGAPAEQYLGDVGKSGANVINAPLDAVPHSYKDIANVLGMK